MEIGAIGGAIDRTVQLYGDQAKQSGFQATLESAMKEQDKKELKKSCQEMESYFVHMMLKEMRKSIGGSEGFVQKSQAESIFEDMLDEQYAEQIAKGPGIGLADMMYKQMSGELDRYSKLAED